MFYSFSYFMNDWATKSGPATIFEVWGIATLGLLVTNFPMCECCQFCPAKKRLLTCATADIFGKVNRQFVSKVQLLQNFAGVYS